MDLIDFLKTAKDDVTYIDAYKEVHIVLGNSACDLDSTVSAILHAYYLSKICPEVNAIPIIPVLNIPRADYPLRTEINSFLSSYKVREDLLTFRDSFDLPSLAKDKRLKLTLVDHNVIDSEDAEFLEPCVVQIIDHHENGRGEEEGREIEIQLEPVGSCVTLVAERILKGAEELVDERIAAIATGTILLDTVNLSRASRRTTDKDEAIVEQLRKFCPNIVQQDVFESLQRSKFDVSGLSAMDVVRKDFKSVSLDGTTIGLSSIPCSIEVLLEKSEVWDIFPHFSESRNLKALLLISAYQGEGGELERGLGIFSLDGDIRSKLVQHFTSGAAGLQLESKGHRFINFVHFYQGNTKASRKVILPLAQRFLEHGPEADPPTLSTEGEMVPSVSENQEDRKADGESDSVTGLTTTESKVVETADLLGDFDLGSSSQTNHSEHALPLLHFGNNNNSNPFITSGSTPSLEHDENIGSPIITPLHNPASNMVDSTNLFTSGNNPFASDLDPFAPSSFTSGQTEAQSKTTSGFDDLFGFDPLASSKGNKNDNDTLNGSGNPFGLTDNFADLIGEKQALFGFDGEDTGNTVVPTEIPTAVSSVDVFESQESLIGPVLSVSVTSEEEAVDKVTPKENSSENLSPMDSVTGQQGTFVFHGMEPSDSDTPQESSHNRNPSDNFEALYPSSGVEEPNPSVSTIDLDTSETLQMDIQTEDLLKGMEDTFLEENDKNPYPLTEDKQQHFYNGDVYPSLQEVEKNQGVESFPSLSTGNFEPSQGQPKDESGQFDVPTSPSFSLTIEGEKNALSVEVQAMEQIAGEDEDVPLKLQAINELDAEGQDVDQDKLLATLTPNNSFGDAEEHLRSGTPQLDEDELSVRVEELHSQALERSAEEEDDVPLPLKAIVELDADGQAGNRDKLSATLTPNNSFRDAEEHLRSGTPQLDEDELSVRVEELHSQESEQIAEEDNDLPLQLQAIDELDAEGQAGNRDKLSATLTPNNSFRDAEEHLRSGTPQLDEDELSVRVEELHSQESEQIAEEDNDVPLQLQAIDELDAEGQAGNRDKLSATLTPNNSFGDAEEHLRSVTPQLDEDELSVRVEELHSQALEEIAEEEDDVPLQLQAIVELDAEGQALNQDKLSVVTLVPNNSFRDAEEYLRSGTPQLDEDELSVRVEELHSQASEQIAEEDNDVPLQLQAIDELDAGQDVNQDKLSVTLTPNNSFGDAEEHLRSGTPQLDEDELSVRVEELHKSRSQSFSEGGGDHKDQYFNVEEEESKSKLFDWEKNPELSSDKAADISFTSKGTELGAYDFDEEMKLVSGTEKTEAINEEGLTLSQESERIGEREIVEDLDDPESDAVKQKPDMKEENPIRSPKSENTDSDGSESDAGTQEPVVEDFQTETYNSIEDDSASLEGNPVSTDDRDKGVEDRQALPAPSLSAEDVTWERMGEDKESLELESEHREFCEDLNGSESDAAKHETIGGDVSKWAYDSTTDEGSLDPSSASGTPSHGTHEEYSIASTEEASYTLNEFDVNSDQGEVQELDEITLVMKPAAGAVFEESHNLEDQNVSVEFGGKTSYTRKECEFGSDQELIPDLDETDFEEKPAVDVGMEEPLYLEDDQDVSIKETTEVFGGGSQESEIVEKIVIMSREMMEESPPLIEGYSASSDGALQKDKDSEEMQDRNDVTLEMKRATGAVLEESYNMEADQNISIDEKTGHHAADHEMTGDETALGNEVDHQERDYSSVSRSQVNESVGGMPEYKSADEASLSEHDQDEQRDKKHLEETGQNAADIGMAENQTILSTEADHQDGDYSNASRSDINEFSDGMQNSLSDRVVKPEQILSSAEVDHHEDDFSRTHQFDINAPTDGTAKSSDLNKHKLSDEMEMLDDQSVDRSEVDHHESDFSRRYMFNVSGSFDGVPAESSSDPERREEESDEVYSPHEFDHSEADYDSDHHFTYNVISGDLSKGNTRMDHNMKGQYDIPPQHPQRLVQEEFIPSVQSDLSESGVDLSPKQETESSPKIQPSSLSLSNLSINSTKGAGLMLPHKDTPALQSPGTDSLISSFSHDGYFMSPDYDDDTPTPMSDVKSLGGDVHMRKAYKTLSVDSELERNVGHGWLSDLSVRDAILVSQESKEDNDKTPQPEGDSSHESRGEGGASETGRTTERGEAEGAEEDDVDTISIKITRKASPKGPPAAAPAVGEGAAARGRLDTLVSESSIGDLDYDDDEEEDEADREAKGAYSGAVNSPNRKRLSANVELNLDGASISTDLLDEAFPTVLTPTSNDMSWDGDRDVKKSSGADPIPEYSAMDEHRERWNWRRVKIGDKEHTIDNRAIEPFKKVLSHGGYYGNTMNAIIVIASCYLPEKSRVDYDYVMHNLFLYVVSSLELLVAQDYMIVYFHGAAPRTKIPSLGWMKKCYQMIDRRLKKNLKGLFIVHPTPWLKTVVTFTRPFISAKFFRKVKFIHRLSDLAEQISMEYIFVPEEVKKFDDARKAKRARPPSELKDQKREEIPTVATRVRNRRRRHNPYPEADQSFMPADQDNLSDIGEEGPDSGSSSRRMSFSGSFGYFEDDFLAYAESHQPCSIEEYLMQQRELFDKLRQETEEEYNLEDLS